MPTVNFILWTIFGTGLVTWLSRITPFVLLKKFNLSPAIIEFLSFVPVTIMAALWIQQLFVQHLGQLPSINYLNLLASLPTVISAITSKNLLVIVIVGIVSAAVFKLIL